MRFDWKPKDDNRIAKEVLEQFERAKTQRQLYEDLWSLIVRIFRPRRYDILGDRRKGEQYGATIYDQHPANALNKFVGGLVGYMVSRSVPWLQFISPNFKLMQLDHIKNYCQEATEQILMAARRSNLYSAIVPHALDAYSIGTSVMIPTSDIVKDRVVFDVVHPKDSYIVTDRYGDPIIYFRPLKLTRLTATEYFEKDKLPATWFDKDGNLKQMLEEQEFIWAVYPNNDRDEDSDLPEDRQFALFCVIKGTVGPNKSKLVLRSGRDTFPICWRSGRESGAVYGTSLAADCLTSGLVDNKLSEKGVIAAHLAVEPVVVASRSIRSSLMRGNLNPGSRIWVDDINSEGAKTFMDRLNWPISDAQLDRIHSQIDDTFFIRFFEMLSTGDIKARTAYEVSQMMAEKATLMSSIVGTFEEESLEENIKALIIHETEAGRMPDVPDELMTSSNAYNIEIKYLGPLDQLQRTLLKTKGTVDALAIIGEMAALDEAVAWKFNFLEAAEEAAVNQGWPQKFVRSDDEVDAIKQQVMSDRAAAQQAETAEKGAKAAASLSRRIEPGSALSQLTTAE